MGEVYRARDTKLGRDVALKVLHGELAADERRQRFEREARLLASLSHPNVATLHGFFEHDGIPFLIMELVPGETLEDRLLSGPLEIATGVALFSQIAEGLAAAHAKGIIHRDLKPANIKITPDGRAKVLDFGLAKALMDEGPPPDMSQSPTATAGGTRAGVILGTASYMSPEQARGQPLDRRTDVWSLAVVLFESLSGKKAFGGQTVTDVLAAIVGKEPHWAALPANTPWRVRDVIRRSLRKDPARRLDAMTAVRLDLDEAFEDGPAPAIPSAPRRRLVWYWAAAIVVGIVLAAWTLMPRPPVTERPVTRFAIELPPGHALPSGVGSLAISPDARHVVYVDRTEGHQLYWRPLDRLEATPLEGAADASFPFFSPDSRWVGFFDRAGGLKKAMLEGGPPVTVAPEVLGFGGTWASSGEIHFATMGDDVGIWRVASDGGVPQKTIPFAAGTFVRVIDYVAENNAVLFGTGGDSLALDLESGTHAVVFEGAFLPAHTSGYLVFTRRQDPMLYAVALEPGGVSTAAPVALGEILDPFPNGITQFDLAANGDLVMATAGAADFQLVWVDRSGAAEPIAAEPRAYHRPRLSPSGAELAVSIAYPDRGRDISLFDMARGSWNRFTFDPALDTGPIWSPDGTSVVFVSARSGVRGLYRKPSDGTGQPTLLIDLPDTPIAHTFAPDGRHLLFHTELSRNIRALDLESGAVSDVVATDAVEIQPVLSPDGRWLAYVSNTSGQFEIYVQPYPSLNGIWQVSSGGGVEPLWSRDGRELFYRNGTRVMSAGVDMSEVFDFEAPKLLFDVPYELDPSNDTSNYDVAPDGRFLMIRRDPSIRTQITVIRGFRHILEEKVGGGGR